MKIVCIYCIFPKKRTPWAKNAIGQVETTQQTRQFSKWVQKNQYECACYKQNDSKKTDKLHIVEDKTRFAGRQAGNIFYQKLHQNVTFSHGCVRQVMWNGDSQFKDLFRGKYENMNVIKRCFQYQWCKYMYNA